jgi:hypothetical protein
MTTISVRLPKNYHNRLRALSSLEGVSINHFITLAIGEKLSAIDTESYITERAERSSREKFEMALNKVRDSKPDPKDAI